MASRKERGGTGIGEQVLGDVEVAGLNPLGKPGSHPYRKAILLCGRAVGAWLVGGLR